MRYKEKKRKLGSPKFALSHEQTTKTTYTGEFILRRNVGSKETEEQMKNEHSRRETKENGRGG